MVKGGLSKTVKVGYGGGYKRAAKNDTLRVNKSVKQLEKDRRRRRDYAAEMSFENRDVVLDADVDMAEPSGSAGDEGGWEDVEGFNVLPPGEEGLFMSNAGSGEDVFHEIIDKVAPKKQQGDYRTRRDRPQIRTNAWRQQMSHLTDAYLAWNHYGMPPSSEGDPVDLPWNILIVDIFDRGSRTFVHMPGLKYTNETLVRHGIIGASPEKVAVGISIRALEVYRQLHRVCPRLSIQAFSTALCHLHNVPFRRHLAEQISIAFDVYLDILRNVDLRVQKALKRDTPDYDRLHVCPPCMYKIEDEPSLKFSMLAAADGNQSLRLVDFAFRAGEHRPDDRTFASTRWLRPEEVDVFKDEVRNAKKKSSNTGTADGSNTESPLDADDGVEEFAWINDAEDSNLSQKIADCVDRWRNAGPEARKKMFSLFAVAGIFLVVCRHGHVLVMCDMIRSGELMKYPLACLKRLFDLYGSDLALGYDIACAFMMTLARSSLGPRAAELRLRGVVPAFHGHSHKRSCQIHWHPMYIDGAGTEDWEECERTFKSSNELGGVTRLATPFHREQQIDQHFTFHDLDKYAATGNFIYQNYRHALNRICQDTPKLNRLSEALKTGPADYEAYLDREREHLESLKSEPEHVLRTVKYMESLAKLQELHSESEQAKADYNRLDYGIVSLGWKAKEITKVKTRYRTTYNRWMAANEATLRLEEELDIESRWTADSPQYQQASVLMTERKYRRALDSLELLVVQRLFELTKLGMSGIGYKMREKIGRALKARSQAIKHALEEYNLCAERLTPPRPKLTWTKVIEVVYLSELDILRDTRQDIRSLKWAQPAHREAMNLYFGLKRAKEEVLRLNVEIRRLLTFMRDDHIDYCQAIQSLLNTDPSLAHELSMRWQGRNQVHEHIFWRLQQTASLSGFSGVLAAGTHIECPHSGHGDIPFPPSWWQVVAHTPDVDNDDDIQEGADELQGPREESERDIDGLVQFMDNLAT